MNKYFENFGYYCEIEVDKAFNKYLKSKNKLQRFLINSTIINPTSQRTFCFYRSFSEIVSDRDEHVENYLGSIHPLSKFCCCWHVIMTFIFLSSLLYIPVQYFDYIDLKDDDIIESIPYMMFINFFCVFDIVLRFLIGYFDFSQFKVGSFAIVIFLLISFNNILKIISPLQTILDKRKIAINYLKNMFFVDFFSTIPFLIGAFLDEFTVYNTGFHFFKLITMVKILRLFTFLRYFRRTLRLTKLLNNNYISALSFLLGFLVIVYWASSFEILPGLIAARFNVTAKVGAWYEQEEFQNKTVVFKYMTCIFKSVSTICGIRSQTYEPIKAFDKIYTSVLLVAGRIGLCVLFAKIYQIIQGMNSSELRFGEVMEHLDKYGEELELPEETKV